VPARPAYAIQIAAYDTRPGAEALAARLRATGLDVRVEGQGAAGDASPFRIKVGRYATRAAAAAALGELRARGLSGFVTTAGPGAGPRP
jgi:cell division protein FtsN